MNIYKIWQTDVTGYDVYDSAVVVAEDAAAAVRISPDGRSFWCDELNSFCWLDFDGTKHKEGTNWNWTLDIRKVSWQLIGEAKPGTRPGVVCASFNAG